MPECPSGLRGPRHTVTLKPKCANAEEEPDFKGSPLTGFHESTAFADVKNSIDMASVGYHPSRRTKVTRIGTDFNEALQVLDQVHQKEVETLRAEVEALRLELFRLSAGGAEGKGVHQEVPPRNGEVKVELAISPDAERVSLVRRQSDRHSSSAYTSERHSAYAADRLSSKGSLPPEVDPALTPVSVTPVMTESSLMMRRPSCRPRASFISFPLREVWKGRLSNLEKQLSTNRRFSLSNGLDKSMLTEELVVKGSGWMQRWIVHPSSIMRLLWDLASMTLLAYDVMAIPFVSAFPSKELDESPFLINMTLFTMIFWTSDVVASIMTGYPEGKRIIMNQKSILLKYLRTWFVMDAILITLDWAYVFSVEESTGGSSARLGRSLRVLRFVRTLRLFRLLKLKRIIQEIQDHINTETVAIIFGIVKIIICLIVANHLVACGWNAVGNSVDADEPSWLKANNMAQRSLGFQYSTALHWSLTQFTPASMEVFPQNTGERVYSVAVLVMAMVCFSSFVSILTASMMELRKIQNDGSRQFWLLRRYMRDWGVSKRTRLRIQRYCEYAYKRQKQRVQEQDVALLSLLSDPLREEVKYETFAAHLFVHPLFLHCDDRTRIFSSAVSAASLARDDQAFSCGVQARHMIFLSNGALEYLLGAMEEEVRPPVSPISEGTSSEFSPQSEMVLEGTWVAEAVLWTPWIHLGDLFALQESQIVVVDAMKFGEAVQIARPLLVAVSRYAEKFLDTMNRVNKQELTDLLHNVVSSQDVIQSSGFSIPRSRTHADEVDDSFLSGFPKVLASLRRKLGLQPPRSSERRSQS